MRMPEADIFMRWDDGKIVRIGKLSTEQTVDKKARIKCCNLYRGLGWAFIKTGIHMMFTRKQKGEEDAEQQ